MSTPVGNEIERQALGALRRLRERLDAIEAERVAPMAIVGMSCRFPGAPDVDAFWNLLSGGGDAIGDIPPERWDVDAVARDAGGVRMPRRAGLLGHIDGFDAEFFGIAGREAQLMDPQQRLFLEGAWEALEDAGIPPLALKGSRTGVFVGATTSDYLQLITQRLRREDLDAYMASGNTLNAIAGRVSYTLGLQGAAMTIDTACSSSLVAIDRACRSLRDGESRLAIAGGVNVVLSPEFVVSMSRWGMLSPEGRCKAFAASADGFVRAEGCGVLVIKRLADALADGDRIRALLRGWAVNQGGASGGFSVPNGLAQADVLRDALAGAKIAPGAVAYVEAHGTGTPLGDPIEMESLANVYGTGRRDGEALWVGAVKTNVGHLEAAAGVAGVIKTVLALERRQIPPNRYFDHPTPHVPWDRIPVRVPTSLEPFPAIDGRRLAGVSSFGFSGTNAHVVLEEAPPTAETAAGDRLPSLLLTLSARSPAALDVLARRYAERLERGDEAAQPICLAASAGRSHLSHRLAVCAPDAPLLAAGLRGGSGVLRGRVGVDRPGVAFLFTGQGAQHPGMGARLAQASPVFREALERCAATIDPLIDRPLLPLILGTQVEAPILARTGYTQPALFAIEVALVAWWRSVGVHPAVVLGHSVGEFAAAWCAGVLSLEDAATLVTLRGALMQALPEGGAMAAVFASEDQVRSRMTGIAGVLAVAGLNAPGETVVSGDAGAVQALRASFEASGVRVEPLAVSHAFHSALMQPMLERFAEASRRIVCQPPALPVVSSMTGRLADADWGSPDYWLRQLQAPVRWFEAMRTASAGGIGIGLEIGPQPVLTGLGRRTWPDAPVAWLASLRRGQDDGVTVMNTLGELYVRGAVDDWSGGAGAAVRSRVALPGYPFQHVRQWIDIPRRGGAGVPDAAWIHPLLGFAVPVATGDTVFQTAAGDRRHTWVRDHRMKAASVWPATASVEMLLAAARGAGATAVELHDVELRAPLVLPEDDVVAAQTVLRPVAAGEWEGRICQAPPAPGGEWKTLVSARVLEGDGKAFTPLDLPALRARCTEGVDTAGFYAALADAGAPFGETFRSLGHVARGPGEAIGRLGVASDATDATWRVHPALLDGCLQLVSVADSPAAGGMPGLWLPEAIGRFREHGRASGPLWGHARLRPRSADTPRLIADLSVWNDDGSPVATVEGVQFVRGRAEDLTGMPPGLVSRSGMEFVWNRCPVEEGESVASSRWQVVGDGGLAAPLVDALGRRGCQAGMALREPRHVVHLAPLDLPSDPGIDADGAMRALRPVLESALRLAQACAAMAVPPRLWFVTRGAQAVRGGEIASPLAATLWGFARVVRAEHPDLRCTVLDVDDGCSGDALAHALLAVGDRESQVALRDGETWFARMSPLPAPAAYRLESPRTGLIDDLVFAPLAGSAPGPGEIRIEVQAAGLNFRDVLRTLGMVEGLVDGLGGECAGRVGAVGEGVTDFAPGDDVFAIAPGGLASSTCVPQQLAARRPENVSFVDAAALPIACLTASYGFEDLAGLKRGDRVLVHAATGGVGMAAVRLAQLLGAEVFATAGSDAKRALLREMGIRHVFDSRSLAFRDEILAATGGQGVQVVLNALAGEFIEAGLSLVAPGGCFLELGKRGVWSPEAVATRFPGIRYHVYDLGTEALRDSALARRLFARLVARLRSGALVPLPVTTYPMREAKAAFQAMAHARHVGKLVLLRDVAAPPMPGPIRGDASYLITGGLGALGLAVARGLARRGARHLVLLGRGAPSAQAEQELAQLASAGVTVHRAQIDVADATALRLLLADIGGSVPPLRGVVHAAGVLDDGVLGRQEWTRFENVLRPKLMGAINLAAGTAGHSLDFLVFFSAGAAWLGAQGQSNYSAANAALDAFAQALRARGRPATAIAWGRWGGAGMAASHSGENWAARGIGDIVPEEGVAAMFELIDRGAASVSVLPIDWPVYLRKAYGEHPPACFDRVLPSARRGDAAGPSLLMQLQALPAHQRREALLLGLDALVRKVVGLPAERVIDPQEPLRDLGMDSLMTIELRNAIGSAVAHAFSATLVFDHPTLDALTRYLMATLPGLDAPSEAISPAGQGEMAAVSTLTEAQAEAELLAELKRGASR